MLPHPHLGTYLSRTLPCLPRVPAEWVAHRSQRAQALAYQSPLLGKTFLLLPTSQPADPWSTTSRGPICRSFLLFTVLDFHPLAGSQHFPGCPRTRGSVYLGSLRLARRSHEFLERSMCWNKESEITKKSSVSQILSRLLSRLLPIPTPAISFFPLE